MKHDLSPILGNLHMAIRGYPRQLKRSYFRGAQTSSESSRDSERPTSLTWAEPEKRKVRPLGV